MLAPATGVGAGRGLSVPHGPGEGQPEGAAGEGAAALCGAEGGKLSSGVVRMKKEATSVSALGAAAPLMDGVSPAQGSQGILRLPCREFGHSEEGELASSPSCETDGVWRAAAPRHGTTLRLQPAPQPGGDPKGGGTGALAAWRRGWGGHSSWKRRAVGWDCASPPAQHRSRP